MEDRPQRIASGHFDDDLFRSPIKMVTVSLALIPRQIFCNWRDRAALPAPSSNCRRTPGALEQADHQAQRGARQRGALEAIATVSAAASAADDRRFGNLHEPSAARRLARPNSAWPC